MPLQVIGAGLPRTGTLSLKLALEELGFGPCHHMSVVISNPPLAPLWVSAFDGTLGDYEQIFKDYNSTTDAPAAFLFDQLVARYPGAKVILSTRDPEKWVASMYATILSERNLIEVAGTPIEPLHASILAHLARLGGPALSVSAGAPPPSKEVLIAMFHGHNARVRSMVPPNRLLEFEATQGWEPLCRFLGVPVPSKPYPRVNDAQEFHTLSSTGKL